ncbi:MAG: hypothetical protein EBU98_04285, partial [Actinobacteria bacterium]|nr:hypothetical protein [Actinomycetota bacterium]
MAQFASFERLAVPAGQTPLGAHSMKQTVLRLVALAAAAGLSLGVVQPAAWADSNSQPVSCDLQADPDSPLCVGDPIFNPDDGDEPRDDDGDEGAQTKPAPGGCYDEYGRWDDSCDVVIDDPQVDPTETCDVAVVTGDDGIDVKVMTCRDEQGNVVYTVTYDAAGCRVKTDAEGNVETECPNPWNQNPVPVCESTDSILDDGTTAWTTVCVDENGNVVYKTYTAHGCTTWADAVGQSETRCEPVCDTQDSTLEDGTTATSTVCVDENGNVVWKSYTAGGCITWSYP